MTLLIDATRPDGLVRLTLRRGNFFLTHNFHCERNLSENLIAEIRQFFQKQKIEISALKKIAVASGPTPFSRIRTAVATANALNYALMTKQRLIKSKYGSAPNISRPKRGVDKFFR